MRNILYHTLVSVLITSALMFFLLPFILFCAPFPAFLAILLYKYINRKLFPDNKVYGALAGVLLLLFIYHFFLFALIFVVFGGTWSNFIHAISEEYFDEFAIPNIPAITLAISIPLADVIIEKVKRDMAVEKEKLKEKEKQRQV